jgi:hypothetical protein
MAGFGQSAPQITPKISRILMCDKNPPETAGF